MNKRKVKEILRFFRGKHVEVSLYQSKDEKPAVFAATDVRAFELNGETFLSFSSPSRDEQTGVVVAPRRDVLMRRTKAIPEDAGWEIRGAGTRIVILEHAVRGLGGDFDEAFDRFDKSVMKAEAKAQFERYIGGFNATEIRP